MTTTTTSTPAAPPTADWIDPVALTADPYPAYARLLAEAPVAWVPGLNQYLVTSYRACRAIDEDQATFTALEASETSSVIRALGGRPMLSKDDPDHAAERRVINPTMRPKNLRDRWMPVFEGNARTYLETLRAKGPQVAELNRDFAAPFASRNMIDLLGFTEVGVGEMTHWCSSLVGGVSNFLDDPEVWRQCNEAREQIAGHVGELLPYYRSNPNDTIISAFAHSGLSATQAAVNVSLFVGGGLNEPRHALTSAVWALTGHPDQRDRVLADPSLWSSVFEETTRWQSPVNAYIRRTTREVELDGVLLPKGAIITVLIAAANRDPAEFERPNEFDIGRPRRGHLAFGHGVHLCAGQWAARIAIGEIALPLLYRELPGLRVDETRDEAWHGWFLRGLTNLPVTWG